MKNIDDQIRRALAAENEALLKSEQQGLFELIGKSFQGKMAAMMAISWVAMFVMFGLAIFSLFKLLTAADISTKINWCVGTIVSVQFLAGMKTWYFVELTKLASARDIRRLELRIMQNAPHGDEELPEKGQA